MQKQHSNVFVLSGCQATLQITGVTMVSVTGLAGFALAGDKAFATVPLTCYVFGSAFTTIPASLLMKAIGRRAGFQCGSAVGVLGSAVCSYAIVAASFRLLCLGMFLMASTRRSASITGSPLPMPQPRRSVPRRSRSRSREGCSAESSAPNW